LKIFWFEHSGRFIVKLLCSPTAMLLQCQRLVNAATFEVWALAQNRGDGHRSLATPESINKASTDIIKIFLNVSSF